MPEFINSGFRDENSKHKLFIAIPDRDGKIPSELTDMLWKSRKALWDVGIDACLCQLMGNPHVDDSRNMLVREFMKTDAREFMFIDSDVVASPASLVALAKIDRPVVAGLYPFKTEPLDFPFRRIPGQKVVVEKDGCIEVDNVPTGFLKIQRQVFDTLLPKQPRWWGAFEDPKTTPPLHTLFERSYFDIDGHSQRLGGDYAFGQKWRDTGGKIHVFPTIRLGHIGKKVYSGDFSDWLALQNGVDHPEFVQAVLDLKNGTPTPETFTKLSRRYPNEWAMCAEGLMTIWEIAWQSPGNIVETGSGLSTLVLGLVSDLKHRQVHALEHDLFHVQKTYQLLERYGVENVTLHYAPLKYYEGGIAFYGIPDELPEHFSMAVIDGPQAVYGRKGAYSVLWDNIRDAVWIADDGQRPEDRASFTAYSGRAGRECQEIAGGKILVSKPKEMANAA